MEIVLNRCFGSFSISEKAAKMLAMKKSESTINKYPENRTDKDLIDVVKELGMEANGLYAELEIVTIPDGLEFEISEYDGKEKVHEAHRSW